MKETVDAVSSAGTAPIAVLLGAGRGGTTLLYKLLSLHRDVAYLSNYEVRAPAWPWVGVAQRLVRDRHELKLRTWFREGGGAYFDGPRRRLHALVPTPIEGEPVYAAAGIPEEPGPAQAVDAAACAWLARRLQAVRRAAGAAVLLTKRTSNNRRVAWLETACPGTRYIHLLRDGRAVAASLVKVDWWAGHALFWAGRTPAEMARLGHDELALAAENWVREVDGIDQALAGIEPSRVLELRYEALLATPEPVLREVLVFMGIDPDADPGFMPAIRRLGLRPPGSGWPAGWGPDQRDRVATIQHDTLARHGYAT